MLTALPEAVSGSITLLPWLAADDAIMPIRDYQMPIPPFKHPPTREDFLQKKPRKDRHSGDDEAAPTPMRPEQEGHVDDFA